VPTEGIVVLRVLAGVALEMVYMSFFRLGVSISRK
jgi:hypothetical protein